MTPYQNALAEIRKYGGRLEVLKMRCFSAYITFEAHVMPARSKARCRRIAERISHE